MIERLRRTLFSERYPYTNPIDRQRAVGLTIFNWVLIATAMLWFLGVTLPNTLENPGTLFSDEFFSVLVVPVVCAISLSSIRRGRLRLASGLFTVLLIAACVPPSLDNLVGAGLILLLLPLVAAGVLLDRRGIAAVAVILVGAALWRAYLMSQPAAPIFYDTSNEAVFSAAAIIVSIVLTAIFFYAFSGSGQNIIGRVLKEATQLRQIARFATQVGDEVDETAILQYAIDMLTDTFRYSSAQILLVDPSGAFTRRVRSGLSTQETGGRINLRAGEVNLVNEVLRSRLPVRVGAGDSVERRSILIPPAESALLVPLLYKDRVLGVVEAQSQRSTTTDDEQLALLADQLASALIRARTMQELQRSSREQQEINARLQQQLGEFRQRSQEVVSTGWSSYLQGRGAAVIGYDIEHSETPTTILATDLPDEIRPALERGETVIQTRDDEKIISVPIRFRGETLGAMSFAIARDAPLTERQLDMVQTVSNRLGLALENTRLFEQSQAQAARERKANEAAGSLVRAINVNAVLNLAAQNFNEALNAIYTRIYLQPDFIAEPVLQQGGKEEE